MSVLILVLMEDTLREAIPCEGHRFFFCLNPCFNGRYSQRKAHLLVKVGVKVLILVLMEDTLRVRVMNAMNNFTVS